MDSIVAAGLPIWYLETHHLSWVMQIKDKNLVVFPECEVTVPRGQILLMQAQIRAFGGGGFIQFSYERVQLWTSNIFALGK